MSASLPHRHITLHVLVRVSAAVLGGYALAWGLIAASASLLFAAGMDFHDAEFLASLIGLLAFLGVFLWAFAARRARTVWTVLVVAAPLLAALGSLVQSQLV